MWMQAHKVANLQRDSHLPSLSNRSLKLLYHTSPVMPYPVDPCSWAIHCASVEARLTGAMNCPATRVHQI